MDTRPEIPLGHEVENTWNEVKQLWNLLQRSGALNALASQRGEIQYHDPQTGVGYDRTSLQTVVKTPLFSGVQRYALDRRNKIPLLSSAEFMDAEEPAVIEELRFNIVTVDHIDRTKRQDIYDIIRITAREKGTIEVASGHKPLDEEVKLNKASSQQLSQTAWQEDNSAVRRAVKNVYLAYKEEAKRQG